MRGGKGKDANEEKREGTQETYGGQIEEEISLGEEERKQIRLRI